MSKEKKDVGVIRGCLVSDQFVFQRRLQELTVGQVYKIKRDHIKYLGLVTGKTKFELIFK